MHDKWHDRLEQTRPISKREWQQFVAEMTPTNPSRTVFLVKDNEGWFVHDPDGGDATWGECGYYRAAMQSQLLHDDAEVRLSS